MTFRCLWIAYLSWLAIWIAFGVVIGIVMGLGETGHIGLGGTVFLLSLAGALSGFAGGFVFAPGLAFVFPRASSSVIALLLTLPVGGIAGIVGVAVADRLMGISHVVAVGSCGGALAGVACRT